MRLIMFRGISESMMNYGDWVYGYLYEHDGRLCIGDSMVSPRTVGQFTGLDDKVGEKIFEGDIGWDEHLECYGVVRFDEGKFVYERDNVYEDLWEVDVEIVGSTYDNPELLIGKEWPNEGYCV